MRLESERQRNEIVENSRIVWFDGICGNVKMRNLLYTRENFSTLRLRAVRGEKGEVVLGKLYHVKAYKVQNSIYSIGRLLSLIR